MVEFADRTMRSNEVAPFQVQRFYTNASFSYDT
jgi:hypothetical protein